MQIRAYDEVDPFQVYKLNMVAARRRLTEQKVRQSIRKDPHVIEGFAIYAVDRGQVLAQVVPLRMPVRLTGGTETVGGIAGVCSHPSVWGRGYARRLMDRAHELYREMGLRLAALTTSRNIRGYTIYRKLGYVDLAPFYRASKILPAERRKPQGVRLRKATRRDLPRIQAVYETVARDLYGWSRRLPEQLPAMVSVNPRLLDEFRIAVRDGEAVGYLRIDTQDPAHMEEVIAPRMKDFRATVALVEAGVKGRVADVTWITARRDQDRFRSLGYVLDGPIADTTMALPLDARIRSRDLPRLFGVTTGRFVQYTTDDF